MSRKVSRMTKLTGYEFDRYAKLHGCTFLYSVNKDKSGLRIDEVFRYMSEEGWDDENDPQPGGAIEIPYMIDGWPVVEIGRDAFENQPGIECLSLPDGIRIVRESGLKTAPSAGYTF